MTRSTLVAFAAGWLVAARRRRAGPRQPHTVTLQGRPDGGRRPGDGLVVEASILARLLRLRLLTLDATILVSPAVVTGGAAQPRAAGTPRYDPSRVHAAGASAAPVGRRLAEAARSVDESAATLARARHSANRTGADYDGADPE